jgi:tetratricopeptide (TPR) repeat protein
VHAGLNSIGLIHKDSGNYEAAEQHLRDALRIRRQQYPPGHPRVLLVHKNLGRLYAAQDRFAEAEASFRKALDTAHPDLHLAQKASLHHELGHALMQQGSPQKAIPQFEQARAHYRTFFGKESLAYGISTYRLAEALRAHRDCASALPAYETATAILEQQSSEHLVPSEIGLADCLRDRSAFGEAEALLLRTLDRRNGPPHDEHEEELLRQLVRLYQAWGKPDEAAPYEQQLVSMSSPGASP